MVEIRIHHLDPGIRDVVAALWDQGIETTDSGDGVSKPPPGIVLPFQHVAIAPNGEPDALMASVACVLADVRPGEPWQIDYARSRTVTDDVIEETILAYRVDERDEKMRPRG